MTLSRIYSFAFVLTLACTFSPMVSAQAPGPGPEHARLKESVGKWEFVLKSSDGSQSKGKSEFKLECGGLWLIGDFNTDFGGMAFQGRGMDGYDPAKKKYVSVWVDSMTPAPMIFEGEYDKTGKVLTMLSNAPGPDGKPAVWRSVTNIISPDEHTFEMFLTPKGEKESSMMVITYKRTK